MFVMLAIVLPCAAASERSQFISVFQDAKGSFQVSNRLAEGWIVQANFTDELNDTGWNKLDVISNEEALDEDQALAAGIAEGYLTSFYIYHYYQEFLDKSFCRVDPVFCAWSKEILYSNRDWVMDMFKLQQTDDYWRMVRLFYLQLDGLSRGYSLSSDRPAFKDKEDVELMMFMINFYPDLGDYIHKYKNQNIKGSIPSCSVLIKLLEDNLIIGHSTWHEYRAMPFRMMKRYSLNYHETNGKLVPGRTLSMSSYPGTLYSLDDFYVVSSSRQVILETTLFVYNTSLFTLLDHTSQVFEPVRVMVSNRLSSSGQSWCRFFEKFNSGTYNNQWMIVDYKQSTSESGWMYVLEQLPGLVEYQDVSRVLQETGYWASYNRAYFPSIYKMSGGQDMSERFGDWFTYDRTPRAQIFRSTHTTVKDRLTMYYLMRFNNFEKSAVSRPPGCNGSIPAASIAARSDLQARNVGCVWNEYDFMVGKRNYGAIDVKIVDRLDVSRSSMYAESGPTHVNDMPYFSWKDTDLDRPEFSPFTTFKFNPVQVNWRSLDSEYTTETSRPSSNRPSTPVIEFSGHSTPVISISTMTDEEKPTMTVKPSIINNESPNSMSTRCYDNPHASVVLLLLITLS